MKRKLLILIGLFVIFISSVVANASLSIIGTATYFDNEYNLIYDDYQGLIWFDYTRDKDTWSNQMGWATSLNLTVNLNLGYSTAVDLRTGWRLPALDESTVNLDGGYGYEGPDENGNYSYLYGYNMLNSEMAVLFYEVLGNIGYYSTDGVQYTTGQGLQNTGPFNSLPAAAQDFWLSTEFSNDTDYAWLFPFYAGDTGFFNKVQNIDYAMAVHTAAVSAVPIPNAVWLLGSGLIGLIGIRKFKKI